MNKHRFLVAIALVFVMAAPGMASASQDSKPVQKPKPSVDLKVAAEQAAQKSAQQSAQQAAQQSELNSSEAGSASSAANGDGEERRVFEDDPGYDEEVLQISGKKVTVEYTNAPPVIDGVLNDPEWNFADRVTDFVQRDPRNGFPGSERTEVRMLYTSEAIYFAFYLYDSEPDRIIAQDLRRDSRLDTDDTIEVILDTFHDRRNGYLFRVNPLATRYDAEVRNERNVNSDWDERWEAATTVTDEGWFAELRIPLSSLRYTTGSHVWGIDFKREIRRKNEEVNWSNFRRGFQFNNVSQAGNLVGLRELGLTQRFRFQPYVSGSGSQFNVTDEPFNEADGSLGVENFKVKITSNLTADFTANTDFAQVEDDSERVNLTRFPLFFPEKREFFLENSSNFQFGSSGGRGFGGPSVSLYHSRQIGLVGGEPVPMIYGAKLTGKVGNTNIGFVNAQTGEADAEIIEDVIPGMNYTVLRLKQDVFERSTVGMIYTNAQNSGRANRVAGVDANFRFYDYLSISGEIAGVVDDTILQDDLEAEDNPITGRFGMGWNSDLWNASYSYQQVDEDFRTDLGFLRRRDVANQSYRLGWNPRPRFLPAVRQFRVSGNFDYLTDTDRNFLEQGANASLTTSFQSGDRVTFNISRDKERLDRIFYVSFEDDIFVLPGDYETTRYWANVDTFNARQVSGRVNISWGDYWDGSRWSIGPRGTFRFNEKFSLSPGYEYNNVNLPTGIFITHVVSTRITYNFNETWLTNSLVQYNSVSGRMSVYARLRYVIGEIDSFYLVYKNTTTWDELYEGVADHQLIAKMTYSVDF